MSNQNASNSTAKQPISSRDVAAVLLFIQVISAERILHEQFAPTLDILTHPSTVVLVGLAVTALFYLLLRRLLSRLSPQLAIVTLLPSLLNLIYLFDGRFQPDLSRMLFGGSLWLIAVLFIRHLGRPRTWRTWLPLLWLLLLPIFWSTLGRDVGTADTFEFQVTAPALGIAHPTGYPLYLLLGKLWTLLPTAETVAMRLNIGTMAYGLFAIGLVWSILTHLFNRPAASALTAFVLGLMPTYWSQVVEAEIYTLHSIFVAATLLLIHEILRLGEPETHVQPAYESLLPLGSKLYLLLAFVLGLGLTNHLTTLLLFPAAGLAVLLTSGRKVWTYGPKFVALCIATFLVPLSLYAYLPIRWLAVNGEGIGFGRFLSWVTGSRFAGALQWRAWLDDPARWRVVGRLFLQEWGWFGLACVAVGFVCLLLHNRRFAALLALTWATFSFYCLNYYVPDLNVFLLPAHLCMVIAWGSGPAFLVNWLSKRSRPTPAFGLALTGVLLIATTGIALRAAATTYPAVDASAPNPLVRWATQTLGTRVAQNATILADSDKFPPLFYQQQAEGMRPDLTIKVLPDEAAYRTELDGLVQAREPVYLARYLPNLPYKMQSAGPLVEINPPPETGLNAPTSTSESPSLYPNLASSVILQSDFDPTKTQVDLLWLPGEGSDVPFELYFRWRSRKGELSPHQSFAPVSGYYPTNAWQTNKGQPLRDFYLIDSPPFPAGTTVYLEFTQAPKFTPADQLRFVQLGQEMVVPVSAEIPPSPYCSDWLTPFPLSCEPPVEPDPVTSPQNASNLDGKAALVSIDTPDAQLTPGALYQFTLNWLALTDMVEDYTVFTQILDANDQIVGQVDSWPMQGTFPTSQWEPGQTVSDPYEIQLPTDLPSGSYRLIVGMYLLRDLRRLPIIDSSGAPIDDKISVPNLFVP